MTDIAMRTEQGALVPDQATPGIDLEVWARQATAAAVYAERVCSTQMAPAAYRGKPAEATAAIASPSALKLARASSEELKPGIGLSMRMVTGGTDSLGPRPSAR